MPLSHIKPNPHSCSKCGGIVRIFCPMDKDSKPCSPNHQIVRKDHPNQSHPHLCQSVPMESSQSH